MFSKLGVSFIFPSIGSVCGSPFPPRGPLERRSPASSVLRRAPTSDRPSRLASFPSLGGTSSVSGDGRISQVPGEPQCERAPVYDPGGTSAPGIAALRCGLPCGKRRRLPRQSSLSRLNNAARSLPVYASQPGSPPNHATLGSGRLPAFAGQECYLLGSIERFQLHLILLSQALPGALSAGTTRDKPCTNPLGSKARSKAR
jgi:hypothetical protein